MLKLTFRMTDCADMMFCTGRTIPTGIIVSVHSTNSAKNQMGTNFTGNRGWVFANTISDCLKGFFVFE